MECVLCNKQYTGKSETAFDLKSDFWIIKLKILQPHGFNAELNFPNP